MLNSFLQVVYQITDDLKLKLPFQCRICILKIFKHYFHKNCEYLHKFFQCLVNLETSSFPPFCKQIFPIVFQVIFLCHLLSFKSSIPEALILPQQLHPERKMRTRTVLTTNWYPSFLQSGSEIFFPIPARLFVLVTLLQNDSSIGKRAAECPAQESGSKVQFILQLPEKRS